MIRRLILALAVACVPALVNAQVPPPSQVLPKTPPKVPRLSIPNLSALTVMSTPNFNTSNPFSLAPRQQAVVRAQLTSTFNLAVGVQLKYTANALSGPASVTIPAGALFTDFNVTALAVGAQTTASVKGFTVDTGQTKLAQLLVIPTTVCHPNPTILVALSVKGNTSITIQIALSCTPTSATTVQITTTQPGVVPPPPNNVIVIPANAQHGQYTTITGNVSSTTLVTISAFLPGTNPIVRAPDMGIAVTK